MSGATAHGPLRARLVQGLAHLGRGRAAPWPRAGVAPARTTRSSSPRWPTAARARSPRSRRPAAGSGGTRRVHDPLGRAVIDARWLARPTATSAVVELAEASGLSLVAADGARPGRRLDAWDGRGPAAALDAGVARDRARHRRQRHDRRRRRRSCAALGARIVAPALDGRRPRPGSTRGSPTSRCASPATSTNPLLGARARPRPTGRRRARRPQTCRVLDARLRRLGRRARGRDRAARARHARGRGGRRDRVRAALPDGSLPARCRSSPASSSSWPRRASTRSSPRPTSSSPARAGSTPRRRSARRPSASPGGPRRPACACIAVGGGVEPAGIEALAAVGAEVVPVHERPLPVEEAMALGAAPLVACGERHRRSSRWLTKSSD